LIKDFGHLYGETVAALTVIDYARLAEIVFDDNEHGTTNSEQVD